MSGKEEQRAILASELYWFGGLRDSNCHQDAPRRLPRERAEDAEPSNRHIHAWTDENGVFHVQIDPIEGCLKGIVDIDQDHQE